MNNHFYMAAENAARDYKNLKEFSENASHEIQTPLAIIHSKLDLLVQQESLTEIQSELIRSVYISVNKLSALQKSLLLLAKLDNRQFYQNSEIRLDEKLKNKIEEFQDFWKSRGITTNVEMGAAKININTELLEILLNNMMSNATRHNITNGLINIKLNQGMLEITNTGINKPLDTEKLFKRFYKDIPTGDNNGLGLSIVKEICAVTYMHVSYTFRNQQHCFCLAW